MDALRLLIAESNEELRLSLAKELHAFHYVRCCGTGTEALEILRREKPDILILDMLLPELDGLTLLEIIASENIRPMVLALSTFWSDYLEISAHNLGVSYAMLKPPLMENVVRRALDLKQYLKARPSRQTPQTLLVPLLEPLSIHPGQPSYELLSDALILAAASREAPLCKVLYREVAKRHNTTVDTVERGIRRLLENTWSREQWESCFPGTQRRPSNKVFLLKMSVLLRQAMEDSGL